MATILYLHGSAIIGLRALSDTQSCLWASVSKLVWATKHFPSQQRISWSIPIFLLLCLSSIWVTRHAPVSVLNFAVLIYWLLIFGRRVLWLMNHSCSKCLLTFYFQFPYPTTSGLNLRLLVLGFTGRDSTHKTAFFCRLWTEVTFGKVAPFLGFRRPCLSWSPVCHT